MHSPVALAFFSLFYRSFYSLLSVLQIVRQNKCPFLVSFINKSTRGKHYFKLTSSIMTKKDKKSRAVWTGTKLSENRDENIRLSFCFLLVFLSMTNSVPVFCVSRKSAICKILRSCLASKQSSAFYSKAISYFYTQGENIKILTLSYNFMVVEIIRILNEKMQDNSKLNDIRWRFTIM